MTIKKLAWRDLVLDTDSYQEIFAQPHLIDENDPLFSDTQPRLQFALEQLLHTRASSSFMLAKAPEESEYLNLMPMPRVRYKAMQANWWAVTMRFPATPSAYVTQ